MHGGENSPWQSLDKVRNALLLALLTTVVAYLIMMLAPSRDPPDGAIAAVGLSASCLTVIFCHPAVPWIAGTPGSGQQSDVALADRPAT